MRPYSRARRRGFFTTDALVGLMIVAALAAALGVAAGRQRRATTRLADTREATHLAERALVALQTGRNAPADEGDARVSVEPLSDAAPAGHRWLRVTATVRDRSASLTGLAPGEARP